MVQKNHTFARSHPELIQDLAAKEEHRHGTHPEVFQRSEALASISVE